MPLNIKDFLTIIIPTYNRYERLERLLNYYKSYNFPAKKIYILDSSDDIEISKNLQTLLKSRHIIYLKFPSNISCWVKLSKGIENLSTPYTVLCADDDFISPYAMEACIKFLELNDDYISAQGRTTSFSIKDNKLRGHHPVHFYGRSIDIDADTPHNRIIQYFSLYQIQYYAVQRSIALRKFFELIQFTNIKLGYLVELLHSFISIILGKHKVLPMFYNARELIKDTATRNCIPMYEITTDSKYNAEYSLFIETLSSFLSSVNGLEKNKARTQILAGMDVYMNVFSPGYNNGSGTGKFKHVPSLEEIKGESGYPFWDNQEAINEWQRMEFYIKQSLSSCTKAELLDFQNNVITKKKPSDVLYAFYDLSVSTTGFDIVPYLVLAELERKKTGCTSLHIVIVPGPDEGFRENHLKTYQKFGAKNYNADSMRWRLRNILIPCCWQIPSCHQLTVCTSYQEAQVLESMAKHIFPKDYTVRSPIARYGWAHFYKALSQNFVLPTVQSTPQALRFISNWLQTHVGSRKVISITLRECPYEPGRNSNLKDWGDFARSLDPNIYYPIIIRDTDVAFDPLPDELKGLTIFPEVVWNMELRSALYELSYLNMSVNNGPAHLCALNRKTRIIIYKIIAPSAGGASVDYLRSCGIEPGSQFKTLTPFQRWVWEDDKFEIIQKTFRDMCNVIENFTNATLSDLINYFNEMLKKEDLNSVEWVSCLMTDRFEDQSITWLLRAVALRLTKQFDEALIAIKKSIQINATQDSFAELILIYKALGRHDKIEQLNKEITNAQGLKKSLNCSYII